MILNPIKTLVQSLKAWPNKTKNIYSYCIRKSKPVHEIDTSWSVGQSSHTATTLCLDAKCKDSVGNLSIELTPAVSN